MGGFPPCRFFHRCSSALTTTHLSGSKRGSFVGVERGDEIRDLCDGPYRDAEKIVVVLDNLNTNSLASFYEAFPPAEAWCLVEKLEIHHKPKQGNWLDIAENMLFVLSRQCLQRRIGSLPELKTLLRLWEERHNSEGHTVSWRFATDDARIKLRRLYLSVEA